MAGTRLWNPCSRSPWWPTGMASSVSQPSPGEGRARRRQGWWQNEESMLTSLACYPVACVREDWAHPLDDAATVRPSGTRTPSAGTIVCEAWRRRSNRQKSPRSAPASKRLLLDTPTTAHRRRSRRHFLNFKLIYRTGDSLTHPNKFIFEDEWALTCP